jgi:hypothetical protein
MGRNNDITVATLRVYQAFYDSTGKTPDQFDAMAAFCKTKSAAAFSIWSAFVKYEPKDDYQINLLNALGKLILEDME